MFGIGNTELIILGGILVLLFGASRLPSLMRNMGRSVNEFKQGLRDEPKAIKDTDDDLPADRLKDESETQEREKVS